MIFVTNKSKSLIIWKFERLFVLLFYFLCVFFTKYCLFKTKTKIKVFPSYLKVCSTFAAIQPPVMAKTWGRIFKFANKLLPLSLFSFQTVQLLQPTSSEAVTKKLTLKRIKMTQMSSFK